MDKLITDALASLKDAGTILGLKSTLKLFFEGLKSISYENLNLRKELEARNSEIASLESQVKILMDEKVDMANSIEFNFNALKGIEESVPKLEELEKKLEESEACKKELHEKVYVLESKIDATEAYERRDTLILSGAVPPVTSNENTRQVVIELIKSKYNMDISPNDISVCHRLQPKRPTTASATKPPNIYAKFVRRDCKRDIIRASKGQPKQAPNKLFANESLTPTRTAILQSLLKIKSTNNTIKGVTSEEGQVLVFTASREEPSNPAADGRRRDKRHSVNTKRELQRFCNAFLRQPLEDLIDSWPPTRQQQE